MFCELQLGDFVDEVGFLIISFVLIFCAMDAPLSFGYVAAALAMSSLFQVAWDEPDLLQNVKWVRPWFQTLALQRLISELIWLSAHRIQSGHGDACDKWLMMAYYPFRLNDDDM
ncbi:hypothetical protein HanXRQr2_Chr01g0017271 [Helianthus annuus]|uniref:Uncharacterized protein n=1 Tax=Helianthus annuus TaxID=4232 RepID=A0A9K3JU00_HELAN|nr:hypothetical protein HanXRQr2_Chr01g0017271 [Helianthus annuus]